MKEKNSSENKNNQKETLTFDDILEKRIGLGKYQYLALFFLCLVDFNDGIELLSMSLILPILKREWEIEKFWLEVISSIFYMGMLFGAFLTGRISDVKGRRFTILTASIIQFLISISFAFINGIFSLIILRFMYGFIYGFSLPLSISMVSEIIPLKYRGKLIVLTNFCVSIGKIWGIFLCYITFESFNVGNWRLMMCLCAITPLLVVFGMVFFVKESPRFLLSIKKFEEAFSVINEIGLINFTSKNILIINDIDRNYFSDKTSIKNQKESHQLEKKSYAYEDDLENFNNFNGNNNRINDSLSLEVTNNFHKISNDNRKIFENCPQMKILSNEYIPLRESEKKNLILFYNASFIDNETANYKVLFKDNILPVTLRLWVCWFALIFIEFGQYAILPFILMTQNNGFGTLLLAIFGEIPAIILATFLIDTKHFGRKNSLALFMFLLILLNILIFFSPPSYFGILISVERFFMKNGFSMLIPLTSELYPTNFRTVGYGCATGIGRFAATISPYLLFPLFYWNPLSAFLIFAFFSFFAFLASYTVPYETSGKYLDSLLVDKFVIN